jgi:hypothetical protein
MSREHLSGPRFPHLIASTVCCALIVSMFAPFGIRRVATATPEKTTTKKSKTLSAPLPTQLTAQGGRSA